MNRTIFITGTDTGVGKTVVTALLARFLRERGLTVAALKPICSGGREDGRILEMAVGNTMGLDAINPWHFRAPIAPLVAAEKENKSVRLREVLARVRSTAKGRDVLLVEGAGGLLSPLGKNFNSRDLISALADITIIVAANRLGVVNHIQLTLEALPPSARKTSAVVLVAQAEDNEASRANAPLLKELGVCDLFEFPWLGSRFAMAKALRAPKVQSCLTATADWALAGAASTARK